MGCFVPRTKGEMGGRSNSSARICSGSLLACPVSLTRRTPSASSRCSSLLLLLLAFC